MPRALTLFSNFRQNEIRTLACYCLGMKTGPKTAAGKATSSQNAYKHGVYSKQLRLRPEEEFDFQVFQTGLRAELKPDGALQSEIFTRLLRVHWTLRRLDRREDDLYLETGLPLVAQAATGGAAAAKEFENTLRYRRHLTKEARDLAAQLSQLQSEAALRTLDDDYEGLNSLSVLVTARQLVELHNLRCATKNNGRPKLSFGRPSIDQFDARRKDEARTGTDEEFPPFR